MKNTIVGQTIYSEFMAATKNAKGNIPRELKRAAVMAAIQEGLSINEIKAKTGASNTLVCRVKKEIASNTISSNVIRQAESIKKVWDSKMMVKANTIMEGMTQEKIDKASLRDQAISFGILFDKYRVQSGQATDLQQVKIHFGGSLQGGGPVTLDTKAKVVENS